MSNKKQLVVHQAIKHFKAGEFDKARNCYKQAAERYGKHLFENSIKLCDLYLARVFVATPKDTKVSHGVFELSELVALPRSEPVILPQNHSN